MPTPSVWWGIGETRTFTLEEAVFLLAGDPDLASRVSVGGGSTFDLRGQGGRPAATDGEAPPNCRYRIAEELGRGGMGVVLRAWDVQLGRDVAIKVLHEHHRGRPEVVRRFVDEARITGQMHHHGIVPVHEFGLSPDGRPFFAMRLVRGTTLEELLAGRPSPLADLTRFLQIFLQISQAVAHAHGRGVIHRDLKPRNVMVGEFGVVKVMDWGLAKVLAEGGGDPVAWAAPPSETAETAAPADGPPATQAGVVFGTPAYLPPEQARGELSRVDRRADVFGLGAILCEILTGRPPYTGAGGQAVYDRAVAADLAEAHARLDACPVPLDLVALAKWCLSPDPADRPASAADVTEVLTAHAQADQRRAERDLVRFFDLSLDLFGIANLDGYFRRVNDNFAKLLGYPLAEFTARPFVEFVHPDDRARTAAEAARMAGGERSVRFLNRYRRADGHYLWLEWNARAILEEQAIYAVARDVTERMAAAERTGPAAFAADAAAILARDSGLADDLRAVAELAVERLGVQLVQVWTPTGDPQEPWLLRAIAGTAGVTPGDGTVEWMARNRTPDSPDGSDWVAHTTAATFAGFPARFGSRVLGVLVAVSPQPLPDDVRAALRAAANVVALRLTADAPR